MSDLANRPVNGDDLFADVSAIIDQARDAAARQVDATLTLRNWHIGRRIDREVLGNKRATYAEEIVVTLSHQLTAQYGRGFDRPNLHRMVKFSQVFPDPEFVVTLSPQLSWSHFLALLPVWSEKARQFYIDQAISARLSVRALRDLIGRQGYERKEIANAQSPGGSAVPADSFKDPYFLDFLGLPDRFSERSLEDAILDDLERFLMEVGHGWAFVARQKRMPIGSDDYYLDLLFYSRPHRRLIAVELKVEKFQAAFKGQMELYLKWLDRYERQPGEEAPIGLILCTEANREQVELLEMHKDGIAVAEYWTDLPPKGELEARIQGILREAKERIARREITAGERDE